jgi:hypothetical protein
MSEIEYGVLGDFAYSIHLHDELGTLCGYLAVPQGHPWFGLHQHDERLDVECHGGVTWTGSAFEEHPHVLITIAWWVGFDCIHAFDYIPGLYDGRHEMPDYVTLKDRDYVYHELEQMASQAAMAWRRLSN